MAQGISDPLLSLSLPAAEGGSWGWILGLGAKFPELTEPPVPALQRWELMVWPWQDFPLCLLFISLAEGSMCSVLWRDRESGVREVSWHSLHFFSFSNLGLASVSLDTSQHWCFLPFRLAVFHFFCPLIIISDICLCVYIYIKLFHLQISTQHPQCCGCWAASEQGVVDYLVISPKCSDSPF